MDLPKEISPNPLLTSTVEIRFSSKISDTDVLGLFYPVFSKEFPKVKEKGGIPRDLRRAGPLFEFVTDYVFENDDYSFSVAKNVVAFENIGTYHLWGNYFPMIKENLKKLAGMNIVNSVTRIGVRYASMFDGEGQIKKILKYDIGLPIDSFEEKVVAYQSNFIKDKTNLFVQIMPTANSQPLPGRPLRSGFYIDIDASRSYKDELKIDTQLFKILEDMHHEEKTFFFSLLNEEFVKTLNPKY